MSGNENKEVEQQGTTVVNMKSEDFDEYIGRGGRGKTGYFGNPFDVRIFGREESLRKYEIYFLDRLENEPGFKQKILSLRGKRLGCFCKPRQCHGDIIVAWLKQYDEDLIQTAKNEGRKPKPAAINAASKSHLKMLAMKMTPDGITTPMRTPEQKDQEHSLEKSLRTKEAQEAIGGNRP